MRCGDLLEYVVPAAWKDRYRVVAQAVAELQRDHPDLRLHVPEDPPSHAAWYAALLPSLGFEMTPRVRMAASASALQAAPRLELPAPYRLATMEPRWLEACVALHLDAHRLGGPRRDEMAENLRDSLAQPDRLGSWTLAFHSEDPVGSCFGSHHRGRLFVEELAVAQAHRTQGLGRALLLETVGRLAQAFPQAETVLLDVDSTNVPAARLYAALGFSPQSRYIVATPP